MARDKIRRFIKKCEKEDATFVARARALVKQKKKSRAAMVLKLRKYRAAQAAKADAQLLNLQQMIVNIQYQELQADVVTGLEQGNKVLKELTAACSIERVELLMEESQEAQARTTTTKFHAATAVPGYPGSSLFARCADLLFPRSTRTPSTPWATCSRAG